MTQEVLDLLKALSTTPGVSGYEQAICDLLRERYAPYVDEFSQDSMSSLTMLKRGQPVDGVPRRSIMLSAHMDEVGAMVTDIDRGFLHFTPVGSLDGRLVLGQEVTVFGRDQTPFHGIIASRPPHFTDQDRNKYPDMATYQIDLGLSDDIVTQKIRVGDLITYRKSPLELLDNLVSGKAFDDRVSIVSLYVCLKILSRLQHHWDVYAVASSQEEVGLKGAQTSAYRLNPDVAIAIDVTFAKVPVVASNHDIELGKGPVLSIGANIHPVMAQHLQETAADLEMNIQIEPEPAATGTDAWAIQTARDGIPTALLGIPIRYMHSPIETVSLKDIERVGRLMAYFIADLSEDFIDDLIPKDGLDSEITE